MPTLVNTLYPPQCPQTWMPAFVRTTDAKVYFSLSPYNEYAQIKRIHISVMNQANNESALKNINGIMLFDVAKNKGIPYDTEVGLYYVPIPNSAIENGFGINQFYKVQLRFDAYDKEEVDDSDDAEFNSYLLNNQTYFSEWSQICLIRPILEPHIILRIWDDVSTDNQLAFNKGIIPITGLLSFGTGNQGETETLQSFHIEVLDQDSHQVALSTAEIYTGANINPNEINYKLDLQGLNTSITTKFIMRLTITTKNQYVMTKDYNFQIADFLEEESFKPDISVNLDNENGIATLKVCNNLTVFGTLYIKRGSSIDNFQTWEDISVTSVRGPIDITIKDNTIGSLVWYRYSVQLENSKGVLTPVYRSEKFIPDFYDAILSRGSQQLRIKYNYNVSSFKPIVNRAKIDTLGSRFPKFAENGILNYKQFSISGSLSAMNDNDNELFLNRKKYFGEEYQNYIIYNQTDESQMGYLENDYHTYINKETFEYNDFFWEREFREAAMAWLNDGEPKLYRSMTEGNMTVMLTDISLTPNKTLSRRVWDFSATIYEIADGNSLTKLDELGIYDVPNVNNALEGSENGLIPSDSEEYILLTKPGQLYQWNTRLGEKNDIIGNVLLRRISEQYGGVLAEKEPSEAYIKNVKIFFHNKPHVFVYIKNAGGGGNWMLADNLNMALLSEEERNSAQLGYNVNIGSASSSGNTTVFVNSKGYYQVPDYIDIVRLSFPQIDDIVTVEYVITYKEKRTSSSIVSGSSIDRTLIGQEMGVFQPNQYLGEQIRAKYNFVREGNFSQKMQFWKGISLDVTPMAIAHVQYQGENKYHDYQVGTTGVYNLIKNFKIQDMCFLGRRMFREIPEKQRFLKEWEFVLDKNSYASTKDIRKPILNTVYDINGNYKIYYQNQWFDFTLGKDNDGIAAVPIEGAINYVGDIIQVNIG